MDSDDNEGMTSATNRVTFDQMTDVGWQWKEVTGPITDDWVQVNWTKGGSTLNADFAVMLAIL